MLLIEMQQDLTVAVRGKLHLRVDLLELSPQLAVVVDLPVDGEGGVPGGVGDGLGPGQQAVDGESLVGEVTVAEAGDPIPVWAPVSQQLREREERGPEVTTGILTGSKQREYPAHILLQNVRNPELLLSFISSICYRLVG